MMSRHTRAAAALPWHCRAHPCCLHFRPCLATYAYAPAYGQKLIRYVQLYASLRTPTLQINAPYTLASTAQRARDYDQACAYPFRHTKRAQHMPTYTRSRTSF